MSASAARAIVFIDGANPYSSLKASGVWANRIDPYKVARKLVESRTLVEVRYYIAEIDRTAPERVYRAFRQLTALLGRYEDVRICVGHIQEVREANPCAHELASYLAGLSVRVLEQDAVVVELRAVDDLRHRAQGVPPRVHLGGRRVALSRMKSGERPE